MGFCADCGAQSGDADRCSGCREARRLANARGTSQRRIGAAIEGQIREAAAKGQGVRLTADEVKAMLTAAEQTKPKR